MIMFRGDGRQRPGSERARALVLRLDGEYSMYNTMLVICATIQSSCFTLTRERPRYARAAAARLERLAQHRGISSVVSCLNIEFICINPQA